MNATNEAMLAGVDEVARVLGCSARHVWGMTAAGKMPKPIRLGRSVRWSLPDLREWVNAGAPAGWTRAVIDEAVR